VTKIAIFVEGQTEQLFAERLIEEIAGRKRVTITKRRAVGGGQSGARKITTLETSNGVNNRYFAVLVDCGADNRVKSDIRDNYDKLVDAGFGFIIGIRDVYPDFSHSEIPKLRSGLNYKLKTVPVQVLFVLGIMEIEAWFMSEYTHFERLNAELTIPRIRTQFGFDPSHDNLELRDRPAEDLKRIYSLANISYDKKKANTSLTLNTLSYETLYLTLPARIPDLKALIEHVDQFLSE
jgi:hypothetical protein